MFQQYNGYICHYLVQIMKVIGMSYTPYKQDQRCGYFVFTILFHMLHIWQSSGTMSVRGTNIYVFILWNNSLRYQIISSTYIEIQM